MTDPTASRRTLLARAAVISVVVGLTMFWIYVFFIAPAAPEDKLGDAAFPRTAEGVCTSATDDLRAANLLNQVAPTPQARADLVERSDARLAAMVQQLRGVAVPSSGDQHAVSAWLDDWDQWLRDRATWVTKLRAGQDAPFDEKARDNGEPYSKALNAFAVTNAMPACVTPYGL